MISPDFTAAGARARGLGSHLFTRVELEALAGHDVPAVARALARSPKVLAPVGESVSAGELDRVIRQTARGHLRVLERWEGAGPVLGVVFAQQDRRSLRAMLRGALATAPAEDRLAGLIPTPTLPERVLVELAHQPTPALVAAHLFAVGHPEGSRLLPLTAEAQPDLLALELALTRGSAARALREAARGDENLRRFVAQHLDLANMQSALLLGSSKDVEPEACFVEGGRELSRAQFLAALSAGRELVPRLRDALAGTALAPLLEQAPVEASRLERAGFLLALSSQQAAARHEPLSSAPVLFFLLRLEAQGRDLHRVLWAAALGAPAVLVTPELVTP